MKQLLTLLVLLTGIGYGQSLATSCAATVRPGTPLACTVSLVNGGAPGAVQFTLTTNPSLGPETVTLPAALAAFTTASNPTGKTLIFNVGAATLPNGPVANISYAVPPTFVCSPTGPCATVTISTTLGSTTTGTAIPLAAGPPASIGSINLCAVTEGQTGPTTPADITEQVNDILTGSPTGNRNGDASVDIVDLQIVVNSFRGLGCTATQ